MHGKFSLLSTCFRDFLSFLIQKNLLAFEKMVLRKGKCVKNVINLGSTPSLAELFPSLLFSRSYRLMRPQTVWEERRGNGFLGPEQALGILWYNNKSLSAGFWQANGTIPTKLGENGCCQTPGLCNTSV